MRVRFDTVEEFLEELGFAVEAPPAAMTPPIPPAHLHVYPGAGTGAPCHGRGGRADPPAAD